MPLQPHRKATDADEFLAPRPQFARTAEMEARLALRTMEERVRGLTGRADAMRRAAENERDQRARARARRERVLREARVAAAVQAAAVVLSEQVERSITHPS